MAEAKDDGARLRRSGAARPAPRRTGASRPAEDEPPPRPPRRLSAGRAMRNAAEQLAELLGRVPESVSALKPTDEGWQADVEVEELERVPETTSVMASYRVTLDKKGELQSYERIRRYTRGQIDRRM